ncbi:MAG: hypothetical protein NXI16_01355 [Alphaproteobacteria bacterium]|nr:hypothetical protein [Alphaproteobacteria bacterium]
MTEQPKHHTNGVSPDHGGVSARPGVHPNAGANQSKQPIVVRNPAPVVETMQPGDIVTCVNGHHLFRVNEAFGPGEFWSSKVQLLEASPQIGAPAVCQVCGEQCTPPYQTKTIRSGNT